MTTESESRALSYPSPRGLTATALSQQIEAALHRDWHNHGGREAYKRNHPFRYFALWITRSLP